MQPGIGGLPWIFVLLPAFGIGLLVVAVAVIILVVRRAPPAAPTPPAAAGGIDDVVAASALVEGDRPNQRPPAPSLAELQPEFPDLELLELIGQGGMGAVYRVRRRDDGRILALKVVAGDGERGEAFAARFLREAEALERLDHPNIVAIRAHGRSGRWCWLLMDHVEGANLRQVLATGSLSPAQALALVPPLCSALQYAHDQGVVHRDIKPENILLDQQGVPHVADFGLAKLRAAAGDEALTGTGAVLGTLHYMAPEQVERARDVDHRADIYALGVVLYELLTGRLPLGRFEPPSQKVAVDVRIDEVVLRALERDPERRWQQASQVRHEVERIGGSPHQAGGLADPAVRAWGMDERTFTVLLHLSQLAGFVVPMAGFVLPPVMWLTTRDRSPRIDAHGRAVTDWVISGFLYGIVAALLCLVVVGIPLMLALAICGVVFPIIGAVRAGEGRLWRYPLSIPFLSRGDDPGERPAAPARRSPGLRALFVAVMLAVLAAPVLLVLLFTVKLGHQTRSWSWLLDEIDHGQVATILIGPDAADVVLDPAAGGGTWQVQYRGGRLTDRDRQALEDRVQQYNRQAGSATAPGRVSGPIAVRGAAPPGAGSHVLVPVGLGLAGIALAALAALGFWRLSDSGAAIGCAVGGVLILVLGLAGVAFLGLFVSRPEARAMAPEPPRAVAPGLPAEAP